MSHAVIRTVNLTRTFKVGDIEVHALKGVNVTIEPGEFVAIMGSSGSGKSTLMNLLGCLDNPTEGELFLDGDLVSRLSKNESASVRNSKIGFVFQGFNLLPRTSAMENVELPLLYDRDGRIKNPRQAAKEALTRIGLADRMDHTPQQLSGGQQQRVAIARALVNQPTLLLADEPTGNLDSRTSKEVMSVFQQLNDEGVTIVLVTHEKDISEHAKRVVQLRDGLVVSDEFIERRRMADNGDGGMS